jgi:F0F1-type ATP synthase membrane subunit b/b'
VEHVDMLKGVILPYANFFIFLGLAVYFFRKPARAAAAKKKADFDRLLAESQAVRDAALAKLAEFTRRHASLDREIEELRSISKQTATAEAVKIIADAERLAEHLKIEARRIAGAEVDKARAELRREIVDAVRASVTTKIRTELKADAHLMLVRQRIGELKNLQAEGQ